MKTKTPLIIVLLMVPCSIFLARDIYIVFTGKELIRVVMPITSNVIISLEIIFSIIALTLGLIMLIAKINESKLNNDSDDLRQNIKKLNSKMTKNQFFNRILSFRFLIIIVFVVFVFHLTRLAVYLIIR